MDITTINLLFLVLQVTVNAFLFFYLLSVIERMFAFRQNPNLLTMTLNSTVRIAQEFRNVYAVCDELKAAIKDLQEKLQAQ